MNANAAPHSTVRLINAESRHSLHIVTSFFHLTQRMQASDANIASHSVDVKHPTTNTLSVANLNGKNKQ